jgi:PTH1 family peptidyl-tRNA hydrolase
MYSTSRHNVGQLLIDRLCEKAEVRRVRGEEFFNWAEASLGGKRVVLVKPKTFMNQSGLAVKALLDGGICRLERLVVVHDDMDLELGRIRFKSKGGDGGHRGVRSILETLGEDRFLRLRIGIGRPPEGVDATDYVLGTFKDSEGPILERVLKCAVGALETLVVEGVERAMNRFHAMDLSKGLEVGGNGLSDPAEG